MGADLHEVELDQFAAELPALDLGEVETGTSDRHVVRTKHFLVERVEFDLVGVGRGE